MHLLTLFLIFLCFISIKAAVVKSRNNLRPQRPFSLALMIDSQRTSTESSRKINTSRAQLVKKDENLDKNVQNDSVENEMNESNGDEVEDEMMNDENNDITKAEENLGMHYFQGDVLTTKDQMAKLSHMLDTGSQAGNELHSRALVKDVRRTWEKGIVPFIIRNDVDNFRRGIIKAAIKHWQDKTCLKFKERKQEKDYVQFQQGNGCSSYVGRIGGKQNVIVGNKKHGCRVGNIIHEIGHSVGFFHEQSRPDRDQFVKINWKNVKKGYKVNFMKFSTRVIDSKDVDYDYDSVMHYPRKIFGKTMSKPTVIPKKDPDAKIGQRRGLSKPDILQVGKLYQCPAKSPKHTEDNMNNPGTGNNTDGDMDPMQ